MIAEEGKAGRKVGEKWSAKMVPSPAASNNWACISGVASVTSTVIMLGRSNGCCGWGHSRM